MSLTLVYILRTQHGCVLSCFSHVWLFATQWTVAHQAPLSMRLTVPNIISVSVVFSGSDFQRINDREPETLNEMWLMKLSFNYCQMKLYFPTLFFKIFNYFKILSFILFCPGMCLWRLNKNLPFVCDFCWNDIYCQNTLMKKEKSQTLLIEAKHLDNWRNHPIFIWVLYQTVVLCTATQ